MRVVPCAVVLVLLGGCYQRHPAESRSTDAGATGARDAGTRDDAGCAEGAACDDGDPCTRADRCLGSVCRGEAVACDAPPGVCLGAGRCVAGECLYEPVDGLRCDDSDPCTEADACREGACRGAPRACDAPPPPVCVGDDTLRLYRGPGTCAVDCEYGFVDLRCADGCAGSECTCVAEGWSSRAADASADVGRYTDVVIDAEGGVHVAYYQAALAGNLRYAYRGPDGRWTVRIADREGDVGGSPSIALDPGGTVHIVYDDLTREALRHAWLVPGGDWAREVVDDGGAAWGGALAIDGAGRLHVVYTDGAERPAHRLGYAVRDGAGGWTTEVVDDDGNVGLHASLAISAGGVLHAVHLDAARGALRHAWRRPRREWRTDSIDDSGLVDGGNDVAIGPDDAVHVSYFHGSDALRHAVLEGDRWASEPVPIAGMARWNTALGVDRWGGVHIVHDVVSADLLHTFRRAGGEWESEVIGSTGYLLSFLGGTALVVDRRGDLHVTHHDELGRTLRYAHRRFCP